MMTTTDLRAAIMTQVQAAPAGVLTEDLFWPDAAPNEIADTVWDMMIDGLIIMSKTKHLMVRPPEPPKRTVNSSGVYPAGPGDYLYNKDGVEVCVIESLEVQTEHNDFGGLADSVRQKQIFQRVIHGRVRYTVKALESYRDGTGGINRTGTILGGVPAAPLPVQDYQRKTLAIQYQAMKIRHAEEAEKAIDDLKPADLPTAKTWQYMDEPPVKKRAWNALVDFEFKPKDYK